MEKTWILLDNLTKTTSSQKSSCQTHKICMSDSYIVFWLLVVSSFHYFKMHAWSTSMLIEKTLLLLHSAFLLSVVKIPLKGEVGSHASNSHGNCIVDHGKSWKNHGIVFLNLCGNPGIKSVKISDFNTLSSEQVVQF